MKVTTAYNNFSRAKIDHDMNGRFDLPIYNTGADVFKNFISNFKGNAIYRAGFESLVPFEDCVFVEFKFNNSQAYLMVFYDLTIRFLSYDVLGNFGWVLDGSSNILEVVTPYSLADCREIQWDQQLDTMYIVHNNHEPRKLVRVAANNFTLNTFTRTNEPFVTYQAQKNITSITQANPGVVTSVAHGYTTGDTVRISGVGGMSQINAKRVTITVLSPDTFSIGVNTTAFSAYTAGGVVEKILTTNDWPGCVRFYKGRLYYARGKTRITTVYASVGGLYDDFTESPITDTSAVIFTIADITQRIEWLFGGDNSLIIGSGDGIVAANGGSVGAAIKAETVQANLTSGEGCNSVMPIRKDSLVFYVGSDGRNMYYFSYDLLTETFASKDANFISYDITRGGLGKMRYKKDRNDLIFSVKDDDLLTLNFQAEENVVGWNEHTSQGQFKDVGLIPDNEGNSQLFALVLRNGVYYIERQAEYVEFSQRSQFFTGYSRDDKINDDMAYKRKLAEELKGCIFLDNSLTTQNLQSNTITFDGVDTITAATNVFTINDVDKQIVYKTLTGYESGRFTIDAYVDPQTVTVSVLQEPTSSVYDDWYLTFETLSGLSQYNGQTVSLVADGGYVQDYVVSGGAISMGRQVSHISIGLPYMGVIKSFCLGFQIQGSNTQVTMKAINEVNVRCIGTMGGKVGSSLYNLTPVQDLGQNMINYLPAIPIDETKKVPYVDDHEQDKCFYAVQDVPGPMTMTAYIMTAQYVGGP
jgi:hypothetical protein